ncbi:MAG: DUF86 domain-containing protein [Methanolinea sp.]|nr:DUF86 domain-containing protein [Methanolinea sp.]
MRNVQVYRYFGIDQELVWNVVERDLPSLKRYLNPLKGGESSATFANR